MIQRTEEKKYLMLLDYIYSRQKFWHGGNLTTYLMVVLTTLLISQLLQQNLQYWGDVN